MDSLCASVINTKWASIPVGSEDAATRIARKRSIEEYYARHDDELFEVDYQINLAISARMFF
jgi:histone deacetylase complex regulatory component SIN3